MQVLLGLQVLSWLWIFCGLLITQAHVEHFGLYVKPKTMSQLRSFLGLANIYSKFVPRYVDLSKVLTPHICKKTPKYVVWNDVMRCAFYSITNVIVSYVIDGSCRWELPLHLSWRFHCWCWWSVVCLPI